MGNTISTPYGSFSASDSTVSKILKYSLIIIVVGAICILVLSIFLGITFTSIFGNMFGGLNDWFTSFTQGMNDWASGLTDGVSDFFSGVGTDFETSTNDFWSGITTSWDEFYQTNIAGGWNYFVEEMNGLLDFLFGWMRP